MLELIEGRAEKIDCQRRFEKLIREEWPEQESRQVVWRPDSRRLDIAHDGDLWFGSAPPESDQTIKRFWNAFGLYRPGGNLFITVEINVATASNGHNVSGYFARDRSTEIVYLMHDGGVGGGRKGVGRDAFLAWSGIKLMPTMDSKGRGRPGILVAPLLDRRVGLPVSAFVNKVAEFKSAVKEGRVPTGAAAKSVQDSYGDYYREFSGSKRAQHAKEVEYVSRHGDVVDQLTRWRPADDKKGERLVKDGFIDLGIEVGGQLKVLYEVKTSAGRQSMYAAIGQLLVHGGQARDLERYVVVPAGERIADDVGEALGSLGIEVLSYSIVGKRVSIRAA